MDPREWDRAAYARRKGKGSVPQPEPDPNVSDATSAAARMEAEFEKRRGEALRQSRRRSRLTAHKAFLLRTMGVTVKQ
jgi:hypothetical protein